MNNLTEEEIEERLKSPENLANRLEIHRKIGNRDVTIPMEIRKVVSILHNGEDERPSDLSQAFDISSRSVYHASAGTVPGGDTPTREDQELQSLNNQIKGKKDKVEERAIDILMSQLDVISDAEITSPTKALKIAKGMADIADKVRNRSKEEESLGSKHLHIHIPQQKRLRDYEVIDSD